MNIDVDWWSMKMNDHRQHVHRVGSKMGIMNPDQPIHDYLKDENVSRSFEEAVADWNNCQWWWCCLIRLSRWMSQIWPHGDLGTNPAGGDRGFQKSWYEWWASNYTNPEPGQKPADIELGHLYRFLYQRLSSDSVTGCLFKGRMIIPT